MAEPGGCAGFSDESRSGRFALDALIRQEFEGYVAVKLRVMSPVDNAHASGAELLEDVVVSDRLPDQGFHGAPSARQRKGREIRSVLPGLRRVEAYLRPNY